MSNITPEALMMRALLVPEHWIYNWGTVPHEYGGRQIDDYPRPLVAHCPSGPYGGQSWAAWLHGHSEAVWGTHEVILAALHQHYPEGIPLNSHARIKVHGA